MLSILGGTLFDRENPAEEALDLIERRRDDQIDPQSTGDSGERLLSEIEMLIEEREELRHRVNELESDLEKRNQRADRIEAQLEEYSSVMQSCAAGHLVNRMDAQTDIGVETEFNAMMDELDETIQQLKAFVTVVVDSTEAVLEDTEAVSEASEQISHSIQEITEGADEQTTRLQALNEEMERLSSSIQEIASSANRVASLSEKTAKTGRKGRVAAENAITGIEEIEDETTAAVETIEDLSEEVGQVSEITDLISDLAEQTNMLALNANIEASRSHTDDDGFGVVAEQVKDLSEETKEAAAEIESRLERIEQKTQYATEDVQTVGDRVSEHGESIEDAATALDVIADYATETDAGVQEISEAANQQAGSVQEVVELADETSKISERTAALAEEVSSATDTQAERLEDVHTRTQEVVDNANWLSDTLDMFKVSQTEDNPLEALQPAEEEQHTGSGSLEPVDLETRVGTGSAVGMSGFETGVDAAREARGQLGIERVDFCQVFCSSQYDYREVIRGIRSVIGEEAELIGCSSAGEFTDHSVTAESVTVGLVASDTIKFHTGIGHGLSESVPTAIKEATREFPEDVPGYPHQTAINLHDGLSGMGDQIALVTLRNLGHDVNFAGGSAGDDMNMEATHVFRNDEIAEDAVVMAMLSSRNPAKVAVNHGHEPISEPVEVTCADGAQVHELDGRPAFEVWKEAVEQHFEHQRDESIDFDTIREGSQKLAGLLTEYEFGIEEGEGIGDNKGYKTRWPGMTETMDGTLDFAVNVPEGTSLRIMYSPKDQQINAARQTAHEAVGLLESQNVDVAGGFVYDCVCRAAILEDEFPNAVKAMADELEVPFAGFETYGELCMERGQMSGFHNTTSVTLVLPE